MKSISSLSLNSLIITHPLNINPFYLYHHLHSIHTFNPLNINPFTIITYSIIPVIHISSFHFMSTINTLTPTIIPSLFNHSSKTQTPYSSIITYSIIPSIQLSLFHYSLSIINTPFIHIYNTSPSQLTSFLSSYSIYTFQATHSSTIQYQSLSYYIQHPFTSYIS